LGLLGQGADDAGHDHARLAHDRDLAGGLQHDRVVSSRLEVHPVTVCRYIQRGSIAMPFLLGLTGNIACGKSTVGQLLADRYAADYVDADRLVHALYASGTPETRAIADRFGADLLRDDGTIDRRRLGDMVMSNTAALRER